MESFFTIVPTNAPDLQILVSEADRDLIGQYRWRIERPKRKHVYARSTCSQRIMMHRLIVNAQPRVLVDHKNGNGLDNRRSNLRICNNKDNQGNAKLHSRNTSGYRGVAWDRTRGKWRAGIKDGNKGRTLGRFESAEEAARAYDTAARAVFGEFASLNFPKAA